MRRNGATRDEEEWIAFKALQSTPLIHFVTKEPKPSNLGELKNEVGEGFGSYPPFHIPFLLPSSSKAQTLLIPSTPNSQTNP